MTRTTWALAVAVVATWMQGTMATDVLKTSGFSNCAANADIAVERVEIAYDKNDKTVTFDVAGRSSKVQNVTAKLNVTAYGANVYSKAFNPCDASTFVAQLCPVPMGQFSANGSQAIPAEYADLVPAIAFQVPDIAAQATLELQALDSGEDVACITSQVTNGKTVDVPAVSYVAASVAGVALVMSGLTAASAALSGGSGAGAGAGAGTVSPSFTEVFGWFQSMAMNGMLSVQYPQVYRSFVKSFGFSTGLLPWTQMLESIDSFRGATGGNLTASSVAALRNTTLVFSDSGNGTVKRSLEHLETILLQIRDIDTSINTNGTDISSNSTSSDDQNSLEKTVEGIQAYVEQLSIPSADTFMTVLLIVAIAIAAITVGILLVKVVLELWALIGRFPASLTGFREHYWRSIARAITTLILLLYGVWVLYCMFQFTQGDSWAAKTLAGVTLAIFTGVLVFFSVQIWRTAHRLRQAEGDASALYEDKRLWVRYSLFYEAYQKQYWWLFVPTIVYMFAKGVALALGDGHGMAQTVALLSIEMVMLLLLVWSRPYERRSGNVINIVIQVVRVLSVVCILVFVEQFGIAQTTQTVAGVALIAVQAALTGVLAILILWNAGIACFRENPHRRRRKELERAEKARDLDTLTPLDARNSLLLPLANSRRESKKKSLFRHYNNSNSNNDTSAGTSVVDVKDPIPLSQSSASRPLSYSAVPRPPSFSAIPRPPPPPPVPFVPVSSPHNRQPSNARSAISNTSANVPIGFAMSLPRPGPGLGRPLTPTTPMNDRGTDSLLQNMAPIGSGGGSGPYYPPNRMYYGGRYDAGRYDGSRYDGGRYDS